MFWVVLLFAQVVSSCPVGPGLALSVDISAKSAVLSNGFICLVLQPGKLQSAFADFSGQGVYGKNVMANGGMTLQREDTDGTVHSSDKASAATAQLSVFANSSQLVSVKMTDIVDEESSPVVREAWTVALSAESRVASFTFEGAVVQSGSFRGVRRQWELQPTSLYAWFAGGVVQMKGAKGGSDFYASNDELVRMYALGGSGSEANAVGNFSFDFARSPAVGQTVLMSSSSGSPYWSGLQEVLAGGFPQGSPALDRWRSGWQGLAGTPLQQGTHWNISVSINVNNMDFPAGTIAVAPNLFSADLQAMMTGIYASPAGNLCTHVNEVADGVSVGQIATTIARPDRGYSGTYNYFDPDNYISTAALLWSNEPYLQDQVRLVLERSGSFLKASGQLPHHFAGVKPVYQALSGEIQTGPNVFWILSCFNYATSTGDFGWLQSYMPTLRLASQFLFSLLDPATSLAKVPGSLMIDVFLRSNFTTDTNAMLVGFFRQFSLAEQVVGNATGSAALSALADKIASAVNKYLWAPVSAGSDHYVTQWNGPDNNTTRDFVDYDANLIASAHGIPSPTAAAKLLARIDSGRCHAATTFVSERYYGPNDTTHGNIGDSWCGMGRIAWFDGLTRKRYGDSKGFANNLLGPLQHKLLASTWMHERLSCTGEQQLNRTSHYFEYPSTVAMLLRAVKYGIELGFQSVTVSPLFQTKVQFEYHLASVDVSFSQSSVQMCVPGQGTLYKYTVSSLLPHAKYTISVQTHLLHSDHSNQRANKSLCKKKNSSNCSDKTPFLFRWPVPPPQPPPTVTQGCAQLLRNFVIADATGTVAFSAPAGRNCVVSLSLTNE